MTASPANFSTIPPCVVTQCETLVEERLDAAAHDLGIRAGDERGRVDEVDEQDRGELAFHASIVETIPAPRSFREIRICG